MLKEIRTNFRFCAALLAVGLVFTGSIPTQAVAADPNFSYLFAFHVPVALQNINSNVNQAVVHCAVTGDNTYGDGLRNVPMQGNNFNGTVIVYILKMTTGSASNAAKWNCRLIFGVPGGEVVADSPKGSIDPIWVTHDPQTKVNVEVSGTFASK